MINRFNRTKLAPKPEAIEDWNTLTADEGADVGADEGTAVSQAYTVPFKFTGKIAKIRCTSPHC